ncbi:C-_U-editing enzyme APOBEC-1-like isoform X2 [Ambystoma mexicanum]
MIYPEEFTSVFDPHVYRRDTYLLFEIQWHSPGGFYRGCCRNPKDAHAEVNFIENIFKRRIYNSNKKCRMTWYLSWSPCGSCARAITTFLKDFPNVALEIRMARLFKHTDFRNKKGLKELHRSPADIYIMAEQDYRYCWRTFVSSELERFSLWPQTALMVIHFIRELQITLFEGYICPMTDQSDTYFWQRPNMQPRIASFHLLKKNDPNLPWNPVLRLTYPPDHHLQLIERFWKM